MSDPSPAPIHGRDNPTAALRAYHSRSLWARFGKRPFDIVVSLVLILLFSPVLLLTAIAIKLTSRGPLLFVQERTGRHGKPLYPIKFRTMRADHVHDIHEIVPIGHSAITPIGKFLRRFKIDELPQLFLVLNGQMSLIGPRPAIPEQTRVYDAFRWRRLLARPGATGLAQVNSSATRSWDDRIKYDAYYVTHHNLLMDLAILAKTVMVIPLGEERFARPFEESPYAQRSTSSTVPTRTEPPPD